MDYLLLRHDLCVAVCPDELVAMQTVAAPDLQRVLASL
jgi:hypothetical protein